MDTTFTAAVFFTAYGPAVRVMEPGNPKPWEFSVRAGAVKTPMRERITLADHINYVRGKIAA